MITRSSGERSGKSRSGLAAECDLVLVGKDWPGCEPIYERIGSLGLGDAVRRPGFVPDEQLVDLYRAAEALTWGRGSMSIESGRHLLHYRLTEKIGEGDFFRWPL